MTTQSDYWCNRSLVITVEGPDSRQRVEVGKPFARLGSHDLSEVLIPDKGVSRRRLYFHATDDGVFCVDLAQVKSATSWPRGWLAPDDCIKLGPYRIWAQLAPPAASEVRPRDAAMADLEAKGTAAEPQPVMVMSIKGKEIARRDLTRQLTVLGRRSPSTLRITSRSVSATHCVLYWKSGILWVVDLFSGNGTRLQGRPIDVAQFTPGDSLKVGRAELHHVDMFEKLPDGGEVEPAEISYSANHEGSVAQDDLDDGHGSEIEIHDSSPEIAESLALAARLATQREEFDAEVAAWNDRRRVADAELAERAEHLTAAQTELDGRKAQWEETRQREEAELTARKSQLEERAAALANEKEQLDALRTQAEEQHRQAEHELADRAGRLESTEELQAELDGRKAQWEETRQREEAELTARKSHLDERAADLANEKEQLDALRTQAEEQHRQAEHELADRAGRLESTEELQAELDGRKAQWEQIRQREEAELSARKSQLEEMADALENEKEELTTLREQAEEERRKTEAAAADQTRRRESLEEQEAEIEDRRREFERETDLRSTEQDRREAEYQKHVDESSKRQEEFLTQQEDAESQQARRREEAIQSERGLAQGREDLERQRSELAAARDELCQEREAWQSKHQDRERSLDERERKHQEASTLLAADRDEFDRLRERREDEHGQTDERLEELAQQLADQRADLQSRRQAWETKRQQDENALGVRSEELNEASAALAGDREQFEAARHAWEEERRRIDAERTDRSRQLAREQADFLQQREEWASQRQSEKRKSRQQQAHLPPSEQATPVKPKVASPARPAAADDPQVARRLEELRQERNQSRPERQSPETGPPKASAISNLDGSPRLAALTTIRRGQRWAPADHTDELPPTAIAFWAWAVVVGVACSGITGAALWFYLTPAYTITIDTGTAVKQNAIAGPEVEGDPSLGPPDSGSPEDIIKSDDVLSEALVKVDGTTFSEISRRGAPLTWLHDELMVSYSSETDCVRVGLRGSYVAKVYPIVDEIAKAFMAEWKPASAIIDSQASENTHRLSLTIAGAALGLLLPILLATMWGWRRSAARSRLPYGLA